MSIGDNESCAYPMEATEDNELQEEQKSTLEARISIAIQNRLSNDPHEKDTAYKNCKVDLLILRPCIEHYMLGVMFGRGGTQELGATFWGQTELSCYDDAQHGIWGMSYKYHERAVVTNERNLARVFDVAFDGYVGGMGQKRLTWDEEGTETMKDAIDEKTAPYSGPDMIVMALTAGKDKSSWPNPLIFHHEVAKAGVLVQPECGEMVTNITDSDITSSSNKYLSTGLTGVDRLKHYFEKLNCNQWGDIDAGNQTAGEAAISGRSNMPAMAFHGSMRKMGKSSSETRGSGHLGHSYIGCASIREGRGIVVPSGPQMVVTR